MKNAALSIYFGLAVAFFTFANPHAAVASEFKTSLLAFQQSLNEQSKQQLQVKKREIQREIEKELSDQMDLDSTLGSARSFTGIDIRTSGSNGHKTLRDKQVRLQRLLGRKALVDQELRRKLTKKRTKVTRPKAERLKAKSAKEWKSNSTSKNPIVLAQAETALGSSTQPDTQSNAQAITKLRDQRESALKERQAKSNARPFAATMPLDIVLQSCGARRYLADGSCTKLSILRNQCGSASGEARWTETAFYCRSEQARLAVQRVQKLSQGQKIQSALPFVPGSGSTGGLTSAERGPETAAATTRKLRARERNTATVTTNAAANNEIYVNAICQRKSADVISKIITGHVCQSSNARTATKPGGGMVGAYKFTILNGETNTASLACVTSRVEAIVNSTIVHYRGKHINASKMYRFCNIVGSFQVNGKF